MGSDFCFCNPLTYNFLEPCILFVKNSQDCPET